MAKIKLNVEEKNKLNSDMLKWCIWNPTPLPVPLTGGVIKFILWKIKHHKAKQHYIDEIIHNRNIKNVKYR